MNERLNTIDTSRLPQHIAIIMDGNGRWAKQRGLDRTFGHKEGANTVRRILRECGRLGIPYLTLYAFSTENWNRPKAEVDALMSLLVSALHDELPQLMENQVRLNVIGNREDLPLPCRQGLDDAIRQTSENTRITLTLALSYSGRSELKKCISKIAEKIENQELSSKEITDKIIIQNLYTNTLPDPDILIRTGGEQRISNFLLWQIAYAELFFSPVLWPDFNEEHLRDIIVQYQSRERRFGKTSEQINDSKQ